MAAHIKADWRAHRPIPPPGHTLGREAWASTRWLSYWWVLPPSLQPRGHRRASPLGLLLKSLMSPNQSPRAGAGSGAADEVSFPQQSVGNGKQMAAARRAHSWHLRSYAGRATGGQGAFLEGPGLGQAGPRTVLMTRSPQEPLSELPGSRGDTAPQGHSPAS